jgi:TnpA family transposase
LATYDLFSPAERAAFTGFPNPLELTLLQRHYLFTDEELKLIRQHKGSANKVGLAVQLGYFHFPGRVLGFDEQPPLEMIEFIANQLGYSSQAFENYATERPMTRRDHLAELYVKTGFSEFKDEHHKKFSEWLLAQALLKDNAQILMSELLGELRTRRVIQPAFYQLEKLVWEVRKSAREQTWHSLGGSLSSEQKTKLDELLKPVGSQDKRTSDLAWLRRSAGYNSPTGFNRLADRLEFIRKINLDSEVVRKIHQNRLSQMAREGYTTSTQHLALLDPSHRYAIVVAFLLDLSLRLTDQALEMHNTLVGQLFNKSQQSHQTKWQHNGKSVNENLLVYSQVGKALIKARKEKIDPFEVMDAVIKWEDFVNSVNEVEDLSRPASFDYLDLMDTRYSWFRQYSKRLLEIFEFKAASQAQVQSLSKALSLVKELNTTAERKVPQSAPDNFITPRWEKYVQKEDGSLDRHFYEFCALSELKDALRSGDMWVAGSRRFNDFEEYLVPKESWLKDRQGGKLLPAPSFETDCASYLSKRFVQLHTRLKEVNQLLVDGKLEVTIDALKGEFHMTAASSDIPEGMDALKDKVYALLPSASITELVVEVEKLTGFSRHFTHQQSGDRVKEAEKPVLLAAILADGINLGISKMADACPGIARSKLFRITDWHIREETYRKALAEVVNYQHHLPFAINFGEGKTSSSDGQQFPAGSRRKGKRHPGAQINLKYGRNPGVMFYTHLSDQYMPYYAQVISATARQAPYMIDGLLYHESELEIEEHYTDTHGYTDQIFGIAHLLGFRFVPRIKDIGDKKLYIGSSGQAEDYPQLQSLISGKLNLKVIDENWEDVLRLVSSIQQGSVTASLILNKLAAYPRQNRLALALREIGRLERTLFVLDWMSDKALRRRASLGLNKGESRNTLARVLFFHRLGEVRERSWEDQLNRASGLTLLSALISTWNTLYLEKAIARLRENGEVISEEQLAHLSPLGWEHLVLTGSYSWNMQEDYTLERLRPLRKPIQG